MPLIVRRDESRGGVSVAGIAIPVAYLQEQSAEIRRHVIANFTGASLVENDHHAAAAGRIPPQPDDEGEVARAGIDGGIVRHIHIPDDAVKG